ncbi:transporter substrate-binding domain-containing protein [Aquamicrobium ahrensii]|uniref:Polar amino acid transport system substrate-binding protein n=1 Tax=Aquamicrobium ahrensii TaxID=469551 RepID=A0ABV2KQF5_9HYPH
MRWNLRTISIVGGLLAAGCVATVSHGATLEEIKQKGELVCATQDAAPPYGFRDTQTNRYAGYDVEMCKAIAEHIGVKLVHKPVSTEARIGELKMGRVDVLAGAVTWLPERAEQFDFSHQYLQAAVRILVRANSDIKTPADMDGRKICAAKGSSGAAIATRTFKNSQLITLQGLGPCYLALQSEKVDGVIGGELTTKRFEIDSRESDKDPVRLLDEPVAQEHIGIIVQKGNSDLLAAINETVVELDKSGQLDELYDQWFGSKSIYNFVRNFAVEPIEQ